MSTLMKQTSSKYLSTGFCHFRRCYISTSSAHENGDKIKLLHSTPENIQHDWIGPSDPVSNIRQFKYHVPKNETPLQKQLRIRREEVQEWSHSFWAKHNRNFRQEKATFIEDALAKQRTRGVNVERLNAEELAVFYKRFLDDNYKLHQDYNREWYKKNLGLLWPSVRANIEKLFR